MAKILHVTECYDGGVSSAIRKLVDLTSEHEHFILFDGDDEMMSEGVKSTQRFRSKGVFSRTRELRRAVAEIEPDFVHLHSSWAGVYGRLTRLKATVVYQPHCYKFDDRSLGLVLREAFRLAEKVLSPRSHTTVVLSPHEESLTRQLSSSSVCLYVPNVPSCELISEVGLRSSLDDGRTRVLMVGRICEQKDPAFFSEVARLAAASPVLSGWVFRWVGDGDRALRDALETAGVEVAGWKRGDELLRELDAADYYLHSASYEGFPISILDAAARGLPVVARSIDALSGSEVFQADTPRQIIDILERAEVQSEFQASLLERSRRLLESRTDRNQEKAWSKLYRSFEGSRA